jgi:hypothetical protein
MKLLPFMDIPLTTGNAPNPAERLKQLVEWANGDKNKLSAAFIAFENDGEKVDDYLFQIGFIEEDRLVTNGEVIESIGESCKEYRKWKEYMLILFEIRNHVGLYYSKLESIPPWGTLEYVELLQKGYTPRVLEGPHKVGKLRPNQKRRVILDASNNMVFGPLLA